jgi:hypothetical protein
MAGGVHASDVTATWQDIALTLFLGHMALSASSRKRQVQYTLLTAPSIVARDPFARILPALSSVSCKRVAEFSIQLS